MGQIERLILAELTPDERAIQRSALRLMEWAAICGATGVTVPADLNQSLVNQLCLQAQQYRLRCYLEVGLGVVPNEPECDGYLIRDLSSRVASLRENLRSRGKPVLLVIEESDEAALAAWRAMSNVQTIGVNRGESIGRWRAMRQRLEPLCASLGYADRYPEPWRALHAALVGADVILKGLTLNRSVGGPDHQGSLYPDEFAALVEEVHEHDRFVRQPLHGAGRSAEDGWPDEEVSAHTESLVAARPLPKGHVLRLGDLTTVKSLSGITAGRLLEVGHRTLWYPREPGDPMTFGVLQPWWPTTRGQPLEISVVIRTKNEADWLRRSLPALQHQRRPPAEIIVVDNESTDGSVEVAASAGCKILHIRDKEFTFGRALNLGIEAASQAHPWVVSLSAHCIPVHDRWLEALRVPECAKPFTAGVYGRQEPLPDTNDFDKRDLWTTFGIERRIQRGQDYFFHNANALIRRDVWERIRFDETLNGVEDRDWAKQVLADGYRIVYEPLASVHHYHGIHQGRNEARAKRVVKVIELIQQREPAGVSQ